MPINALNAVALLYRRNDQGRLAFLGSCFSLRHQTHFLTAAHCVHEVPAEQLMVVSHVDQVPHQVLSVESHPKGADVALLTIGRPADSPIESFWDCVGNFSLGEEFFAFGFPEDAMGPNEGRPTPRLFKGYFHRFMPHQSHMGYRYIAGELSTPCPGGLSGAPLFRPGAQVMLTGVVAENLESSTLLDSQEQVLANGQILNEHYRSVVNFGIAVMLEPIKDWLNEKIPPRSAA